MRRRAVIIRRPTEFGELIDRYSTRNQAGFILRSRGRTLGSVERAHESRVTALARVRADIPGGWASANVEHGSLSRFLFAPEDIIVVVGPDGLVTNTAKYVSAQVVVGINSVPGSQTSVPIRCAPEEGVCALRRLDEGADLHVDHLTMVQASADGSQSLRALNGVLTRYPSHQSVCYELRSESVVGRQSSSGLVVSTGTEATGWEASLKRGHHMGELSVLTSCSLA